MANVVATDDYIFVAAGPLLYRFSATDFQYTIVNAREVSDKLPKVFRPREEKENGGDDDSNVNSVDFQYLCLAISPCQNFLVVGTSHKSVVVVRPADLSSPRSFRVPKAPTSITFDKDSQFIIVGDRAGHVCRYSVKIPERVEGHKEITGEMCYFDGEPLMGAISMVLDVAISPNNKYLIVADRDEKVRIHRYPHAYVIEAFGLGHAHYVSSVDFYGSRLFSTGGDSQLKEWDLATGRQLFSVALTKNEAVKKIIACQKSKKIFAFAANSSCLIVFEPENGKKFVIDCHSELLDICQNSRHVFGISRNGLISFDIEHQSFLSQRTPNDLIENLATTQEPIASFFKNVRHNNMNEYHKRKAEKIMKDKGKKQRKRKNPNCCCEEPKKTSC